MVWVGADVAPANVAAGTTGVLLGTLNAAALALRPFTVVRTRQRLQLESDQVVASEQYRGAYGFIVVSENAAAQGIAAVPKPNTDTDADWFVYEPFAGSFLFISGAGFTEPTGTQHVIDSKAMRKVGVNEDIAIVIETTGTGMTVQGNGRFLIKLH